MSATDPNVEFLSTLDDFWAQLWTLKIGSSQPSERIKQKFFAFVKDRCSDVDDWRLTDDVIGSLFSEFVEELGNW